MFYSYDVTIPANTAESSPASQRCFLTVGKVTRLIVSFPPGCAGLVHVRILAGTHQVWPSNPDGSFRADGYAFEVTEDYSLEVARPELVVQAWNDDDTYSHTVTVAFGVERKLAGLARVTAYIPMPRRRVVE